MSHELRTPLNAIMGFSDIMRARMFGPLTDRYGEYAELIHESGGHLLDLINDVLDMSKIEAERFELQRGEFDAREAVTAAMRLLRVQADAAGVQLRGVLPPDELEVDADRRALKQIVLNLVSNALKFTPRGGQVTVTADGHDGEFELVVADTGVGISPEDLERLGRPYEQAGGVDQRAKGTGLGLSLVRAFAKLHGGEMNIESRLGAGTSVSVRMPVLLKASRPAMEAPLLEPLSLPEVEPDDELGPNVVKFAPPAVGGSPTCPLRIASRSSSPHRGKRRGALEASAPLWGRTDRVAVRVGASASRSNPTAETPAPPRSRRPPHTPAARCPGLSGW